MGSRSSVTRCCRREGFGKGGVVGAKEAVELKMADRIGTLDDAIALAARRAGVKVQDAADATAPAVAAEVAPRSASKADGADLRFRLAERGA